MMLYKLIITFDARDGEAGAGQRFFAQNIAPLVQGHGRVYVGEIWWTMWGEIPQFLGGIIAEGSADALRELVRTDRWQKLWEEFQSLVDNLSLKLVQEEV